MKVRHDFDPADPGESELYAFDYTPELAALDYLTAATFGLDVLSGVDASVATRIVGSATVAAKTGSTRAVLAVQRLTGLQAGVRYRVRCVATTFLGNSVSLYANVTCRELE